MNQQRGDSELILIAGLIVLLVVVVPVVVLWFQYLGCHARWDRAGMSDVSWGPIQGCLVKMPDGRWLPSDRVREMDLPKPK